jgi:hypothetical protein
VTALAHELGASGAVRQAHPIGRADSHGSSNNEYRSSPTAEYLPKGDTRPKAVSYSDMTLSTP